MVFNENFKERFCLMLYTSLSLSVPAVEDINI